MKYVGSYHQERIWFIDAFERGSLYDKGPVYHNIPLILYVKDGLNRNIVKKTLEFLESENEILRTKIVTTDNLVFQEVMEQVDVCFQCMYESKDLSSQEIIDKLLSLNSNSFSDGITDRLFKAYQLNTCKGESYLLIILHHSICDDYSKNLLKEEFITVYKQLENGETPSLNASSDEYDDILSELLEMDLIDNFELSQNGSDEIITYKDYAENQKEISDEDIENEVMYWKGHLNERIQALEIPTDNKRAAVHIYEPAVEVRNLSDECLSELKLFTDRYGISKKNFFLGVFKILLKKYSQLDEINIGTSISDNRAESVKNVIGPISNLVLLSDELNDSQNALEIIEQTGNTYEAARSHSLIPFDKLVMEINPENDMSRTAFFDVLFNYVEEEQDERFKELDYNLGWGKYDYNLLIKESETGIRFIMTYNKLYFMQESIERLLKNMETLCRWIISNPKTSISEAAYVSEDEIDFQLNSWNESIDSNLPDETIHSMFEKQAQKWGQQIALKDDKAEITYEQLNRRANQVANYLNKLGITFDDKVAIILDKDIECIAIILGILKAGAAYVPIDSSLPSERVMFMLEDCKAKVCIAKEDYSHIVNGFGNLVLLQDAIEIFNNESEEFTSRHKADSLAYIIYTSGTTGKPKGVLLEHKNVTRLIRDNGFLFNFTENDVWTMFHSYNFDFSVWEMYGCLLNGGMLVLISKDVARDVKKFHQILIDNKVTILNQTPSAFYTLSKEESGADSAELAVRMIIFGGEALNTAKLADWRAKYPNVDFINMYGITETTVHVTYKKITDEIIKKGENTIGTPLPTYSGYVMDKYHRIVPVGVKGEFVVGGSGVCRGYLNLPELTANKFIDNPYLPGERLYCSGDLVRLKNDGELEYLGRIDKQVQIRGFRIEIGEIETTLLAHPDIEEACVVPKDNGMGSFELVGYVVTKEEAKLNYNTLGNYLKETLPEYMVPSKFIGITSVPITGNGKVDTRKLLEMEGESLGAGEEYVAPTTELQKELIELWQKTIDAPKIGIYDNFFHLGGNSILVTKLMFFVSEKYNVEIPYRYFFTNPTVKDMENYLLENASGENKKSEQIDWEKEMQLQLDISENITNVVERNAVLLTGATGFLGSYMLKSLLEKTDKTVYCLVRADNKDKGLKRITDSLEFYNINVGKNISRVQVVLGDLGKAHFNLSEDEYNELAKNVDSIYHNGALALYGYSYEQLRDVNVLSTAEIIKFASVSGYKAIHYISTISVFDGTAKEQVLEDDIPDFTNMDNQSGYGMTKLISEALLRRAREKGLKVNIYRPGRISGCSKDGACQDKDFLWMMMMATLEVNAFIPEAVPSDMVPVDILADSIIDISVKDTECGHNFNLNVAQETISGKQIKQWLSECGHYIDLVSYDTWYEAVVRRAKEDINSACGKLMPVLPKENIARIQVNYDNKNACSFFDVDKVYRVNNVAENFKDTIRFFQKRGIITVPGIVQDIRADILDENSLSS